MGMPPSLQSDWRIQWWSKNVGYSYNTFWEKVSQPSLIVYGDRDDNVPVQQSIENLHQAFATSGNNNYRIIVGEDLGHSIRIRELEKIAAWLEDQLDGQGVALNGER